MYTFENFKIIHFLNTHSAQKKIYLKRVLKLKKQTIWVERFSGIRIFSFVLYITILGTVKNSIFVFWDENQNSYLTALKIYTDDWSKQAYILT